MWLGLFAFEPVLFFFDDQHRKELVGSDVAEGKRDADPEGSAKIERPAQELSGLGVLRRVQPVQRPFLAAAPIPWAPHWPSIAASHFVCCAFFFHSSHAFKKPFSSQTSFSTRSVSSELR